PIYTFLGENFFPKYEKKIDNNLPFKTSEEKGAFLQAMFDDDGSVSKEGTISITHKKDVINYISKLLNEFGIKNKKYLMKNKIHNKVYYCLRMSKFGNKKFLKYIGFKKPSKQKRLKDNPICLKYMPHNIKDMIGTNKECKTMLLNCKNKKCMYEWDYKGEGPFYATCPRCKSSVKVKV
ncbi:unnamed protein product, partial [marine sediment metagenome]